MNSDIALPRIRCAICGKLVDRVEYYEANHGRTMVLTVFCHGDSESMEIDCWDQMANPRLMQQMREQEGVAFATHKIPHSTASPQNPPLPAGFAFQEPPQCNE